MVMVVVVNNGREGVGGAGWGVLGGCVCAVAALPAPPLSPPPPPPTTHRFSLAVCPYLPPPPGRFAPAAKCWHAPPVPRALCSCWMPPRRTTTAPTTTSAPRPSEWPQRRRGSGLRRRECGVSACNLCSKSRGIGYASSLRLPHPHLPHSRSPPPATASSMTSSRAPRWWRRRRPRRC